MLVLLISQWILLKQLTRWICSFGYENEHFQLILAKMLHEDIVIKMITK